MITQLPQIQTLSSTGVFLKLLQDGVTVAGQISKIKADIHLTNSGKVPVEFTLRAMADTVKVGSSQIATLVPGQTKVISFDDWFNRVEFLANGVTSVMVRGTSNAQFGINLKSRVPGVEAGVGTIDSTTPPFDYPQSP